MFNTMIHLLNNKLKYAAIAAVAGVILLMIFFGIDAPAGFGNE